MEHTIVPTAVVCVTDNGGSSGRLRRAFDIPAVGDLRNCLVALSPQNNPLANLFQYRLPEGADVGGHSVGNVVMTALLCRSRSRSLREAVRHAGVLMQSNGLVLPSTEAPTTLCAEFEQPGVAREVVKGEVEITRHGRRIRRVWLEPNTPEPTPGLIGAILAADVIVLGPGSLYTSIIPNLLVRGVPEAIRDSGALTVLVTNLMSQPGESDGYTAADHLSAVEEYLGEGSIRVCVVNSKPIQTSRLAKYRNVKASPVELDFPTLVARGVIPMVADVLDETSSDVRHDPLKLARTVTTLWKDARVSAPMMKRTVAVQPRPLCAAS